MRNINAMLLCGVLCLTGQLQVVAAVKLDTEEQKFNYIMGLEMAAHLKRTGAKIDLDSFVRGVKDTLEGKKAALSPKQIAAVKQQVRKRMLEQRKEAAGRNLAESKKFLEENKKKEGVQTTVSGLQYKVIKEGEGAKPKPTDTVSVQYRGTLVDGTEFDSSYKRGQSATFRLNRVIKGWTEGLQLMPVGSTYRFFIPPDLAYGERGAGPQIGPSQALIFDVELLEIK